MCQYIKFRASDICGFGLTNTAKRLLGYKVLISNSQKRETFVWALSYQLHSLTWFPHFLTTERARAPRDGDSI